MSQRTVTHQTWEFGVKKHREAGGNEIPSLSNMQTALSSSEMKSFAKWDAEMRMERTKSKNAMQLDSREMKENISDVSLAK